MSDLVTRLRNYVEFGGVYRDDDEKLMIEAASTIESLQIRQRELLARLEGAAVAIDEYKRDAERYRWLRDRFVTITEIKSGTTHMTVHGDALDYHIDAAQQER
jgi:hypothetical protein